MNAPLRELQHSSSTAKAGAIRLPLMQEPLLLGDSGMPLLELLSAMRSYHQRRDFSHRERFGAPDQASERALLQLDEAQRVLQRLAADASDTERNILVQAQLSVTLTAECT